MKWLSFIFGHIFAILTFPFRMIWFLFAWLFQSIIGSFSWVPPYWLQCVISFKKKFPRYFWGSSLLIAIVGVATAAGIYYQSQLPQPLLVSYNILPPKLTPYADVLKPKPLEITFYGNREGITVENTPSVIPINQAKPEILKGLSLTPRHPGQWKWKNDYSIEFLPSTDWPADQLYRVNVSENILNASFTYHNLEQSFKTRVLSVKTSNVKFYQDPSSRSNKRLVATYEFSHPIDTQSFERHLSLTMQTDQGAKEFDLSSESTNGSKSLKYKVKYDKHQRKAYVISENLNIPEISSYAYFDLNSGVTTKSGTGKLPENVKNKILVPDRFSFLKVSTIVSNTIKNENQEPEQVLSFDFTDEIDVETFKENLDVYLLPKKNKNWKKSIVNKDVLSISTQVFYRVLPNQREQSSVYNVVIDVPQDRQIFIVLNKHLPSVNDFLLASSYKKVMDAPNYPIEASILGEGSVYSISGDRVMGFMTRGLSAIKVRLGKVPEHHLNHLISQTYGNISNPQFRNYYFTQENIIDKKEVIIPLMSQHPKEANYASLDLTPYLLDKNQKVKSGLFFVEIVGWNTKKRHATTGVKDHRLVMITDLGVVVKKNRDGEQDVFVQSLSSGLPLSETKVELLGKNGLPIMKGLTQETGHVQFSSAQQFYQEQTPTVYKVSRDGDISFLPFENYNEFQRQLNFSRFDISGESYESYQQYLKAFLFSDRGIYRPGESIDLGIIIKQEDFSVPRGVTVNLVVDDPRGHVIFDERFAINASGFIEQRLETKLSSSTGFYNARLYLIDRNGYQSQHLGSTQFKVEEFKPNTIKVNAQLFADNQVVALRDGWLTTSDLAVKVKVENLFGTPAQNRKVTAKMVVSPVQFNFDQYRDYEFLKPLRSQASQQVVSQRLKHQTTDDYGETIFPLPLNEFKEGTYQVKLFSEGFEPDGGRSVKASASVLISPFLIWLGIKLMVI